MKVRGDLNPGAAFTVEARPKRRGYSLVRFYENAAEYSETMETGQTVSGWEYDEYHLMMQGDPVTVETEVENDYERYFELAKAGDGTA